MKELLMRWHELEPSRCRLARPGEPDPFLVGNFGAGDHGWRVGGVPLIDNRHILAETIAAIEARGWTLEISTAGLISRLIIETGVETPESWQYEASVDVPIEGGDMDWYRAFANSPAEALLRAYTEALQEAQNDA